MNHHGPRSERSGPFLYLQTAVVMIAAAVLLAGAGGCTAYERAGYSPIPQSTPSPWSLQPYGEIRN